MLPVIHSSQTHAKPDENNLPKLPERVEVNNDVKENNESVVKFVLNEPNEVNDSDSNKQTQCFGKGNQNKRRKSLCRIC